MNIYRNAEELIGKTPLIELCALKKELKLNADIFAKLEMWNPAGSVKDRVARSMLDDAERSGQLTKNTTVIEPTSGNTGIGLASVAAMRGYKVLIVMPDNMSVERQKLMKAYGAELVLSDGKLGMEGAVKKADELAEKLDDAFVAGQFVNPANPAAHYETTGPEIYNDLDGRVDCFVAGVGTGGTLTGTGRYLKERNPEIKVVAVEPAGSPLLNGGKAGSHAIQGIGANFVPKTLDRHVYDEVIDVENEAAFRACRMLGEKEGILAGISSGAALDAAVRLARRNETEGKNIVVIFPDTASRYMSTDLFPA